MMLKWLKVENKSGKGELYLYGDIVTEAWYDSDVAPKSVKAEIDKLSDASEIDIYINSPGGEVFAGMAIYNMLKRIDAKKRVFVDGVAASIASVIAMAGDELHIPANAMFMIHNPSAVAWGESDDLRKMADALDKVKETIVAVYKGKVSTSEEELSSLMDDETWMTGEEAFAYGFADVLNEPIAMAASVNKHDVLNVITQRYKKAPKIEEQQNTAAKLPAEPKDHTEKVMAYNQSLELLEALAC